MTAAAPYQPPGPRRALPVETQLAVLDVVSRYTHIYDAGAEDGLADLFCADAVFETEPQPAVLDGYPFPARGRDAIMAALTFFQRHFGPIRRRHILNPPSLTPAEGDTVRSIASFVVIHSAPGASTESVGAGVYDDVLRRDPDGWWRIAHRVVHRDRSGPQIERFY